MLIVHQTPRSKQARRRWQPKVKASCLLPDNLGKMESGNPIRSAVRGENARQHTAKVTGRMGAPRTLLWLALLTAGACAGAGAVSPHDVHVSAKKIELFEGVTMHLPEKSNKTENKLVSFEIDTNRSIEEGRGKQKKLMERILPMFIMPFIIQSTIVPMFLSMLKFMLFKSMMVGKLALALILFNAFRNHNTFKGRQEEQMADVHYGYHGTMEEYGAYVN